MYSDLSPWEACKILAPSTEEDFDWVVDFNDGLGPLDVQEGGMRTLKEHMTEVGAI